MPPPVPTSQALLQLDTGALHHVHPLIDLLEDDSLRLFGRAGGHVAALLGEHPDLKGYDLTGWFALMAPKGVSDQVVTTLKAALKESLKTMSYGDFLGIVASGRKNVSTAQENVMPAFGDNPNVACYMDDLYVYLRARANDAWGRARPATHEDKTEAYTQAENSCMGTK